MSQFNRTFYLFSATKRHVISAILTRIVPILIIGFFLGLFLPETGNAQDTAAQDYTAEIDPDESSGRVEEGAGEESSSGSPYRLISIVGPTLIAAFFLVAGIYVLILLKNRISFLNEEAEEAESSFLESALAERELGQDIESKDFSEQVAGKMEVNRTERGALSVAAASLAGGQSAGNRPPESAAQSVDELAKRLMALQIVTEYQGKVALSIAPEGQIYGLKRGGACILLPRLESPEAMSHFVRRFDIVFVIQQNGEVGVYERLQSRMQDLTDLTAGKPGFS